MLARPDDRFTGSFLPDRPGRWEVQTAGGALVLARRLVDLRRDRPALSPTAELHFLDTGDDRALAFLRRTWQEELLVVVNRDAAAVVETTVTLPADEGDTDSFAAVDLLGAAERRLGWRTGACPVTLPPGGALLLRLDR